MRRLLSGPTLLLLAALLGLAIPPATAEHLDLERWKANDSGWGDVKPGTLVHYRTVRERFLGASEAPVKDVTESKRTLKEVKETEFVFELEVKVGEAWTPARRETVLRPTGYTTRQAEIGPDEVQVGNETYECMQIQSERLKDGVVEAEAMFWIHREHGVLRIAREYPSGAGRRVHTVTDLELTRKVGAVTLTCRAFDIEAPGTTGSVIVSNDVPGGIVELALEIERPGAKSTLERKLIGFVKK